MGAEAKRIELDAPIGVEVKVKGEMWSCVEIPDSAALFGTGRRVRVDPIVDELMLENVGAMVTGRGGCMLSLSAKARKSLGAEIDDEVHVVVTVR